MKVDGCNANIEVLRAYYEPTAALTAPPTLVEILVQINDWRSTLMLPTHQLNASGIQKKCTYLKFRGSKAKVAFDEALLDILSSGISRKAFEYGYYFKQTGATILPAGNLCFLRGAELIGSYSRPYALPPEVDDMQLCGQGDSPSRIVAQLLTAPSPVLLVFAYVILTSIRSLLIDSGIGLQAVLYIVGNQGLGKTTLATRIAGIYEKSGKPFGVVQAGSSLAAVNLYMVSMRDQPVIVDDLCLSVGKETARKRVELASQLIRQGTGAIPIMKQRGRSTIEFPCEAGLILTAEFSLSNLSDLTRCIIVPIKKALSISDDLTPDLVGDAVRHYSSWLTIHAEQEITRFHKIIDSRECPDMDKRMSTNYACLEAAFQSFVCSLSDLNFSADVGSVILNKMDSAIKEAQQEQQKMITQIQETVPVGNLAFCILNSKKNHAFDLTDKIKNLHKHGGIVWEKDLCLRPDELTRVVCAQPGYHEFTQNQITRSLKNMGALVIQEDNAATVHLQKGTPRVYRIRLNVLEEAAESYEGVR